MKLKPPWSEVVEVVVVVVARNQRNAKVVNGTYKEVAILAVAALDRNNCYQSNYLVHLHPTTMMTAKMGQRKLRGKSRTGPKEG